jgi:hypothetical protein
MAKTTPYPPFPAEWSLLLKNQDLWFGRNASSNAH